MRASVSIPAGAATEGAEPSVGVSGLDGDEVDSRRRLARDLGRAGKLDKAASSAGHVTAERIVGRFGGVAAPRRWTGPEGGRAAVLAIAGHDRMLGLGADPPRTAWSHRARDGLVPIGATSLPAGALDADYVVVVAEDGDRAGRLALVVLGSRDVAGVVEGRTAVPSASLLASVEAHDPTLRRLILEGRLLICDAALGLAGAAIDSAVRFAVTRPMEGGVLADMQVTRHRLAELLASWEMAAALLSDAWSLLGDGASEATTRGAMALLATCEATHEIVDGCLQLFGGRGFLLDNWLARALPDVLELPDLVGPVPLLQETIGSRVQAMTNTNDLGVFRARVRRFAATELLPHVEDWERERTLPRSAFKSFADAGFTGLMVPRSLGGRGKDARHMAILVEEMARAGLTGPCASLATVAAVVCPILASDASEDQRQRWLEPILAGDCIPAIAVTEPTGGSDLSRTVRTVATATDAGWVVRGEKMLVTNAPIADLLLVLARTGKAGSLLGMTVFGIAAGADGISRSSHDKLGMRSSPMGRIRLDGCVVSDTDVLGETGRGFAYVADPLVLERLLAVIAGAALASACVRSSISSSAGSVDRGTARAELASLLTRVEAGRAFAWQAVGDLSQGRSDPIRAALAKAAVGDLARQATMRCQHLCGGEVDVDGVSLARAVRDLRAASVAAGTSETMRDLAGTRLVQAATRAAMIGADDVGGPA